MKNVHGRSMTRKRAISNRRVPAAELGEIIRAERERRKRRGVLLGLGRTLEARTQSRQFESTWLLDARMAYEELGHMLEAFGGDSIRRDEFAPVRQLYEARVQG